MLVYIDDREDEELDDNYGYDYGEEDSSNDSDEKSYDEEEATTSYFN